MQRELGRDNQKDSFDAVPAVLEEVEVPISSREDGSLGPKSQLAKKPVELRVHARQLLYFLKYGSHFEGTLERTKREPTTKGTRERPKAGVLQHCSGGLDDRFGVPE